MFGQTSLSVSSAYPKVQVDIAHHADMRSDDEEENDFEAEDEDEDVRGMRAR